MYICTEIDEIDMRILYVTDALAVWGGIERVLSVKINYMVQKYGYEVFVVTADQGDHPIPFPLDERVHIKDLNIRFHQQYHYSGIKRLLKHRELESLFCNRLAACIAEIKPCVISCIRDGYVCSVLKVASPVPVIFESHAMYKDVMFEKSTITHLISTFFQRKKFNRLNKIVALTLGDANDWSRVCKNVCVIPNVVHLNDSDIHSTCVNKRCIFAGRFDNQKNVGALIKIWTIVQKHYPDWILDVYGNGHLKPYYEKIVLENKLNIVIHPAVPDIFDKFMESSMLLMTSLYEPFGLVLAEAMSCGLPVVAFNCPYGPADVISDGVDGFLVEDRNIVVFAGRVCQLIEDEQLRQKMSKAAVQSAQRYKADIIMPQWNQLFEELSDSMALKN